MEYQGAWGMDLQSWIESGSGSESGSGEDSFHV